MQSFDLDVHSPHLVPAVLRKAADAYRAATLDLQSTWQDESAGRVWTELAKILDRAADSADKAVTKFF